MNPDNKTEQKPEPLSAEELARYSRHIMLPELGLTGQQTLKAAKVLLVGAGGLGSPLGLYLAAAGVGTIGIVDNDVVESSNLQRQVLYTVDDIGQPKAECAARHLVKLNPYVKVNAHNQLLEAVNALEIVRQYDLVIDGSDNFATRYLVNDACVLLGKVNVYGSIFRFDGQASVFNYKDGPCYRCIFPEPPEPGSVPSCAEAGVLGVLPGLIASIQATEAIKVLTGIGESLCGRLMLYDALGMSFKTLKVHKNPECNICGSSPTITSLQDYDEFCGVTEVAETAETEISPAELKQRLDESDNLLVIDVREPYEKEICRIEGSTLIPLQTLPEKLAEFSPDQSLVFYCKTGGRSAQACKLFRQSGFKQVKTLRGGINAWAEQIEPDMPRY